MIKKILCLLIIVCSESGLLPSDYKTIQDVLNSLMSRHKQDLLLSSKNNSLSLVGGELSFFTETSFLSDTSVIQFLKEVNYMADSASKNPNESTYMSFTRYSSINGIQQSIQYKFESGNGKIHFSKMSNIDGKILKADYNFDIKGKTLRAEDYKNSIKVTEKLYQI